MRSIYRKVWRIFFIRIRITTAIIENENYYYRADSDDYNFMRIDIITEE